MTVRLKVKVMPAVAAAALASTGGVKRIIIVGIRSLIYAFYEGFFYPTWIVASRHFFFFILRNKENRT